MARDTLFRHWFFKRLITYLNAFPVRRQSADIGAIKESLRRLKQGRALLLFPEGTRTPDGRIGPMMPGLGAIAKKARAPIVPILIDGMYQAWPKGKPLPVCGDVIVEYGEPIRQDEYAQLSPEELMAMVRTRLIAMQRRWHSRLPGRRLQWFESEEN